MTIQAVVFDIGGVLEITPRLGVAEKWEEKLKLRPGELNERLGSVWEGGATGKITLQEVHNQIGQIMDMDEAEVNAFMDDVWTEYLGTLNVELANYFRSLRPKYQTAIISNSFIGAREKEAEHYQFDTICDFIIYSHEVGLSKPDPRIFQLACDRFGLAPSEIIFVDDHWEVMETAHQLGIHCIVCKDTTQTIADIEACIKANA